MKWGKCEIWSAHSTADEDVCFLLISSYQHKDSIFLHCDALLLGEW
jgi:hypothetical protein